MSQDTRTVPVKSLFGGIPLAMEWVLIVAIATPPVLKWVRLQGIRWLYILAFSFLMAHALTPLCRWAALRFSILDVPDARKKHGAPTPLLGGVAIYVAFISSMMINNIIDRQVLAILLASSLLFLVGLIDDIKGLKARIRLGAQVAAAVVIMLGGIKLNLFPPGLLGDSMEVFLTVVWILGITNAMNFLDGMDGLASGLSAIISFFLGMVAFQTNQPFLGWFALAMLGSSLGFLPHNFLLKGPAKIFLGDLGSTLMGFILACLAVKGEWAQNDPIVSFAAPVLIFGVPIFDMTHTTIARIVTGKVRSVREWVEHTGRDHFHHRVYRMLGKSKLTVLSIWAYSACLGVSAVVLRNARTLDAILLVLQGIVASLLFVILEFRAPTDNYKG